MPEQPILKFPILSLAATKLPAGMRLLPLAPTTETDPKKFRASLSESEREEIKNVELKFLPANEVGASVVAPCNLPGFQAQYIFRDNCSVIVAVEPKK